MIETLILGVCLIVLLVVAIFEQTRTINRLESELKFYQQKISSNFIACNSQTQDRFHRGLNELNLKALKREAEARGE